MEIRFFLTGQDAWNFQKSALLRPRVLFFLIPFFVFLLGIIVFLTVINSTSPMDAALNVFPFVILFIVMGLMLRWRMTRGMARRLAAQGEQTITISPEGFRHKTNLIDGQISWRAIKVVKADRHNLYFMVDSNVLTAHVIPRRAFAKPQDAETFLSQAKSYWLSEHS